MATIALLGSGEFLPWAAPVDRWCVERAPAGNGRVLVVPTASAPEGEEVFDRWATMGIDHYRSLGLDPVLVPLRARTDAFDAANVGALEGARLVFFSGGNPGYLAETLAGTPFWEALVAAVAAGTALGGCSAGAVSLGSKAPFVSDDGMLARWVAGLGLLSSVFVAPHFNMLDSYMEGLRDLLISERPAGSTLVGIDEDTALYGDGEEWTVAGAGGVWVMEDGSSNGLVEYREGARLTARLGLTLP